MGLDLVNESGQAVAMCWVRDAAANMPIVSKATATLQRIGGPTESFGGSVLAPNVGSKPSRVDENLTCLGPVKYPEQHEHQSSTQQNSHPKAVLEWLEHLPPRHLRVTRRPGRLCGSLEYHLLHDQLFPSVGVFHED